MKCNDVKQKIMGYLDGEASPAEQAQIAAHLRNCPACRAEEAAQRQADKTLSALAGIEQAPDRSLHLPPRTAGAILRRPAWLWIGATTVITGIVLAAIFCHPPGNSLKPARPNQVMVVRKQAPPAGIVKSAPDLPETEQAKLNPKNLPDRDSEVGGGVRLSRAKPRSESRQASFKKPAPNTIADTDRLNMKENLSKTAIPAIEPISDEIAMADPAQNIEAESAPPQGIILLLGEPRELPPSSSYAVEVTMADGAKSIVEQNVERDATGATRSVKIAYEQIPAQNSDLKKGG